MVGYGDFWASVPPQAAQMAIGREMDRFNVDTRALTDQSG
jgi:hypothetical protein